ncbi:MAG: LysR family transcriptional regulator [Gammaproteobacteria bacterium]|nr:LysR family transcriptional regulator [Gammaproteobacteria bacterium]MCP4979008.1 LysR family transcriptional regulator [Gammaproteobacteria bacterium]
MKRPRLNSLRTFAAAGRHLSFSLAAQELKISQAAVSQQMRQLESYLDAALFVRHNRRLSLTNTGQAYLDTVHEALDRLDSVTDQLFPGRHSQTVTLRCTSGIATLWLAPQLKSLQQLHPGIELRIKTLDNSNDPLSASDLEIFIAGENKIDSHTRKLLTSTITPVCSPTIFAHRPRPTNPTDLLDLELIHVLGYDDDWHRWFRIHQKSKVKVPRGLSVDGSLIAIEAALRGDGIMLGRRPFIDRYLQCGDLVEVFIRPMYLYSDYYLRQPAKTTARRENKIVAHWLTQLAT